MVGCLQVTGLAVVRLFLMVVIVVSVCIYTPEVCGVPEEFGKFLVIGAGLRIPPRSFFGHR